ncbi:unnamed protein product [Symbiodinium natans]|uniref:NodB homology domain-containing protein n=1 Tax=Symbiodinium natans TaxID=878477 RepID=A0A812MHP9_9DINO|nr:unnamed protein product [Symbiodinium natans]
MSTDEPQPTGWDGFGLISGDLFSRSTLERLQTKSREGLLGLTQSLTGFLEGIDGAAEPDLRHDSWKLGYCCGRRLYWEEFDDEAAAERRYNQLWWSRIILDPQGRVVKCFTAALDPRGVGVARLIIAARLRDGRDIASCPLQAMNQGDAPFIPPEWLPGIPQALQVLWNKVASRESISWFGAGADSLCYFDVNLHPNVKGYVALTIDDVPCRLGPTNSFLPLVQTLLKQHDAHATLMLMGNFIPGNEDALISMLSDGHEFGNHGLVDRSYAKDSRAEFVLALDECSDRIKCLQRQAGVAEEVRWFRAPHGRISSEMTAALVERGLQNVMCDTFACCPVIQDGEFIGTFLGRQAEHGSIILIHMPEKGFREWCFHGLQSLLMQLAQRGLKATTVGHLAQLADYRLAHL